MAVGNPFEDERTTPLHSKPSQGPRDVTAIVIAAARLEAALAAGATADAALLDQLPNPVLDAWTGLRAVLGS